MFNPFKKKPAPIPEPPKCNCGAWPDPSWKSEDFIKKHEAVKLCPIHKDLQMVMVVHKSPVPLATASIPSTIAPSDLAPVDELGQELRAARLHLLNCTELVGGTDPLWAELNVLIETLEEIIEDEKV